MRIEKKCKVCGNSMVAIKTNQYFCSRKCFKKDYNIRKREERKYDRENNPARYGYYQCTACGLKSILPYSPKRYKARFETYECPGCHTPRFKNPSNMREEWPEDDYRFSYGYKHQEVSTKFKDLTISVTFHTFLSGGTDI